MVWLVLVANSPVDQRWISTEELDYIESSLADDTLKKVPAYLPFISSSVHLSGPAAAG